MGLDLQKSSTMVNSDGHDNVVVQLKFSILLLLIKEMYKKEIFILLE